jgi:hypothetical protein
MPADVKARRSLEPSPYSYRQRDVDRREYDGAALAQTRQRQFLGPASPDSSLGTSPRPPVAICKVAGGMARPDTGDAF